MRKIILSAVLGLGALGLVAAMPSKASAFYWPPAYGSYYYGRLPYVYANPYGYTNWVGNSYYNWYRTPYSGGFAYNTPAIYRSNYSPWGFNQTFVSPSYYGLAYSRWNGLGYYSMSPGIANVSYSPIFGYRSWYLPGTTIVQPAGPVINRIPAGYVIP